MQFKDSRGRPLTQGLFLEIGYNTEFAVYTLKDEDFEYGGKVYPSLKRLYLEMADPIEYNFSNTHLSGWNQWQRIANNKVIGKHVEEWRRELELKLRSEAVSEIISHSKTEKGFQAAKWLADRGYNKKAGRPSKEDVDAEKEYMARISQEFDADILRIDLNG